MTGPAQAPHRRNLLLGILALLLALGPAACQPRHEPAMLGENDLPDEILGAPFRVREAYSFAAANPDLMREVPCYCGCGAVGHTSNYDCYVASVAPNGRITYELHALGCSVCVEITQDAMRLLEQGSLGAEIRAFIDARYARYGPSNMP